MSVSVSERERLNALASYDILDTAPEETFDRVVRLVSACFDVPAATVAFVGGERTWGKAYTGFDPSIKREHSFCLHVVLNNESLVLEDARRDPRFADNPMVVGEPGVRFYAGTPIRTPDHIPVGTVCLYDTTPRSFSAEDMERLRDFAGLAEERLEWRSSERKTPTAAPVPDEPAETTEPSARPTDGVLRLDPAGRVEWANDRFVEMTGYTMEELEGKYPGRLLYGPATDEETIAAINQHLDQRASFCESLLHYRKSGAQYWVQVEGKPLSEEGTHIGFRLRLTDTTEEHQRADAVTALTSFYEYLLQELPVEVAVMNPEGRYLFLNPAGVSDDELREWLIGKTALDYARRRGLDPEPFQERLDLVRTVVETNEPNSLIDPVTTDDGETRYILRVLHPITDETGEVVRVFGYGVDLTERRKREQKLVEAKERAEEMNRLKTAFLANMSHEIRTPLTSIIGFAEVLADTVDEEHQEMIDLIQRSGTRLKETLTSVLELARLEEEERTLSPGRLDLVEHISTTVELLRPRVQSEALTLAVDLPDTARTAVMDGAALDRILTNLLTNAIKFTEDGQIAVRLTTSPDTVSIQVSDTGCGISPSFQEHIYQAFEQESSGMARTHEGTGLGLTIIHRLVELMDGTIHIDSEKGVGTTVTMELPRFAALETVEHS